MESPGIWNAAEDEENFARCRRRKWLLRLVVFPFLAITICRQRRHTHWPLFRGRPFASALRPKYIHTRDLPLDLAIRAMLSRAVYYPRPVNVKPRRPQESLDGPLLTTVFLLAARSLLLRPASWFGFWVHYCHLPNNKTQDLWHGSESPLRV